MKCGDGDFTVQGRVVRVASLVGEKYTFPDDPASTIMSLRNSGTRADILTFLQGLPETRQRLPYHYEMDNLAVLPVTTFDHWWEKQIRSYPRNRARQAAKRGVVLREIAYGDALVKGICEVYNETPIRQGKRFPHYGMTMERGRAYAGTFLDRSIYIAAYIGESMIGFAKVTMDESRTQAALVHILSMAKHKDKAPTNALIAEAVRACEGRGISYLIYENFTYGNKVGDSLSRFKEVNGFVRVDVPRYYIPLTTRGKLALRWGLHGRVADWIPESIAGTYRELRRSWYSRRFQSAEES